MEYEHLELLGSFGLEVEIDFPGTLEADFGDGYERSARTGHPDGLRSWRLVYKVLPGTLDNAPESGPLSLQSRADYLWDFFIRHKSAGNRPFIVTCPRDGQEYLAKFLDRKLTYTLFATKLFSSGLALRQRRDGEVWV
jgi:hypothetical protein